MRSVRSSGVALGLVAAAGGAVAFGAGALDLPGGAQRAAAAAPGQGTIAVAVTREFRPVGIRLISGGGGRGRFVPVPGGGPPLAWSPDGRRLLYQEIRGRYGPFLLRVMDRTGRNRRTLWTVRGTQKMRGTATWAPDSRRLIYDRDVKTLFGGRWVRRMEMYITTADGRRQRRLALHEPGVPAWEHERSAWNMSGAAWSPDGSTIALSGLRWDGRCFRGSCDPRGGEGRIRWGIWLADPETGAARLLHQVPDYELADPLVWSPDGSRLAFSLYLRSGSAVYVLRVATGSATRVASGGAPVWSPDGGRMAYVRGREVRVMRADGTGDRDLVPGRIRGRSAAEGDPVWSPDGRRIAFTAVRTPADPRDTRASVYVVPASGGPARRLTGLRDTHNSPTWSRRPLR
jgi:Tol biopolymer transport system component